MNMHEVVEKKITRVRMPYWSPNDYLKIFITTEGNLNMFCEFWSHDIVDRQVISHMDGFDSNEWEEYKGTFFDLDAKIR